MLKIFEILLELSLWPENTFYEIPSKENFTCYKTGRLIFKEIYDIQGVVALSEKDSSIDPDGTRDWGNIYGLRKNGNEFEFETDFTQVRLTCKEVWLILEHEK